MMQRTEQIRINLEELKRTKVDCFKMCFRIKVSDAIEYATIMASNNPAKSPQKTQGAASSIFEQSYILSFVMTNPVMYEAMQEGHRYRFFNVKPECFYRDSYRIKAQSEAILI